VSSYKKVLKDFVVLHYSFHFGTLWNLVINHIVLDSKQKLYHLLKRCLLDIIDKEKKQEKRICSICTKEEEKQSENS